MTPSPAQPLVCAVPWSQTIDPGPSVVSASMLASAISRSACSQEIRCHLPDPRGPARLSGWRTRPASYIRSL